MALVAFDPANKGTNVVLSNSDLTLTKAGSPHELARADIAHDSGIWYFEVTKDSGEIRLGIVGPSADLNQGVGETVDGWGYQNNGFKFNNGSFVGIGISIADTDVVGVIADLDAKTISIITPGPVTTLLYSGIDSGDIYAAGSARNGGTQTANFGATAFTYAIPVGARSWDHNQPAETFDTLKKGVNVVLSNNDLSMSKAANFHESALSLNSHTSGIRYFEIVKDNSAAEIRAGIMLASADYDLGVAQISGNGIAHQSDGRGLDEGAITFGLPTVGNGESAGILVDFGTGIVSVITPGPVTTQLTNSLTPGAYFAAASARLGQLSTINAGATPFVYPLPAGASAWNEVASNLPEVTSITPVEAFTGTLTNIAIAGSSFTGMTQAKWDDSINPITTTTLNNVTANSADTDINLILGTYTLTLSDGITDYLQDETLLIHKGVNGNFVGTDNTQTRVVNMYSWSTGALLQTDTVDLNLGTTYKLKYLDSYNEVFIVSHKQGELAPFVPILSAGPVVGA